MHESSEKVSDAGSPDESRDAALQRALAQVEDLLAAERRKDEFLATLCHELRGPIGAIHQATRLLSRRATDLESRRRAQDFIERQVHRMTQLIEGLLDLSRIAHGQLHLHLNRVDLCATVRAAVEMLQWDIQARRHRLITVLPYGPVWLQADPLRLEQVFANLLANAAKYTDPGGELELRVHAEAAVAVVRIRDSGIGMERDALAHIFDLYRQIDAAGSRSQSGLGIGLALVRSLVESHGGSVTAESQGIGCGSAFTVRLPRVD